MTWRGNYFEDVPNPFGLAGPPAWFCAQLYAFDSQLVIFPSSEMGAYRVARKTGDENAIPLLTPAGERKHGEFRPDQRVYVNRKLVPITTLLPFTNWSPSVLLELAEHSFERAGGWQAAARRLEDFEDEQRAKQDREIRDNANSLAHMTWWGAQFKTGGAVDLGSVKPEGASTAKKRRAQPVYRPLNFAGGSAVFAGTPARTKGSPELRKGKPRIESDLYMVNGKVKSAAPSMVWTP